MKVMRRMLGILVMIAGILGLVLSVAGLVGIWMAKPSVTSYLVTTVGTLNTSISTSQHAMDVTQQALGATVDSLDALSGLLTSTADSVEDTKPLMGNVNNLMAKDLPATLQSAHDSLESAQQSAAVLDGAIKSIENFQSAMSGVPLVSAFVEKPTVTYNPEKSLAESLGDVATNLEGLPAMFTSMAGDLDKADDNLDTIESGLSTMSSSVGQISDSLGEYQAMISQSRSSVENLSPILTGLQTNLTPMLDGAVWVLTLFFLWLLAIQIVILSQGWELYQGTAGRMEGGPASPRSQPVETA